MLDDARRWTRVKQVFQDALDRPADGRGRFLQSACGDDRELQGEVESLLVAHAAAGTFAQGPAIDSLTPSAAVALLDGAWADLRLQRGARLGHYEVLSAIGKGGMGEVWKARDTTLGRDVAIKMLPEEFAQNADHLANLAREATLLASLNHPNIATIHGLEEDHGTRFLVLELVEGRTLADRLWHGPVPLAESLKLGLQVAEALEAAHEKGVIHRDLKPANIKVTPERRVKVLDFGLAKAMVPADDDAPLLATSSSDVGIVIGTPAYMSPEQARGEGVGRQADIWSFGVVLFELLTGVSPFLRSTTADTLASVLGSNPDYSLLPPDTPALARQLVRRCLEKDLNRRWQHMGDVRIEVEEALSALAAEAAPAPAAAGPANGRRRWVAGAIAVILLAGVTGWLLAHRSTSTTPAAVVRLSIPALEPPFLSPYGARHLAISEDGSRVAYASENRLWIRRLGQTEAVTIEVTAVNPFFSPNGEWVGFFGQTGETGLTKVSASGGTPIRLVATSERSGGGTWRADGTIVFATSEGLYQVSENGGEARLLVKPDPGRKERGYAWPRFLPGGRSLLFTIIPDDSIEGAQIAELDLNTLEAKVVLTGGSAARYTATGHLVYASGQTLKAIAFDPDAHRTRGDPVSLPNVEVATTPDNGAAEFALSETGTLIFVTPSAFGQPLRTLSWVDRLGKEEPLALAPGHYEYARISPDGTRIALDIPGANRDIWIWNRHRPSLTKLTSGPTEDFLPVWSRDGLRVFFASNRTGNFDVYSQAADGASTARVEFAGPGVQLPNSFTPDGTRLIVIENFKDLSILNLKQPDRLEPLLHSEFNSVLGEVSPDGNWLVYESNESGNQIEVFLRPFPDTGARREKVSIDGGRFPRWGPKGGGELFYVDLKGAMMAAAVKLSPSLTLGHVTKLFELEKPPRGMSFWRYDISPVDGRFLITRPAKGTSNGTIDISVALNWLEDLRERVPLRPR